MGEAIFQFLFKYPAIAYSRGHLALASSWPAWVLVAAILLTSGLLAFYLIRFKPRVPWKSRAIIWAFQSLTIAILLLLLWRPSLILSAVVPQQNVLPILVDDSSSMAMADTGTRRIDQVRKVFDGSGSLMSQLQQKFQVRLYYFSRDPQRLRSAADLTADGHATHLESSLSQVYSELRHLPLVGVVVVSDGADNGPGTPQDVMEEIKARKLPVYTVGVGQEEFDRDVELQDIVMPRKTLPGATVSVAASVRQRGYIGQTARIEVRDGSTLLKSREITFGASPLQTVQLNFTPKSKGLREYSVSVQPLPGEAVRENNVQSQLVDVEDRTAKVLYVEGEPKWEYKFIRRAMDDDSSIRVVSMVRTAPEKYYRQGIENEQDLQGGFPDRKQLFQYEALVVGSIQSNYFSAQQQEDIYAFVSRRGGGLLFLGGRYALGDGGYQGSSFADLLPVQLQSRGGAASLQRVPAKFQLTARGADQMQLADDEKTNREDWQKLPALGDYQLTGDPKPGAVVMADAVPGAGKQVPVLVSQRFGRGRTWLFATDGSWHWRMQLDYANKSHETFWRQMMHSLVAETPATVSVSTEKATYLDEPHIQLTAQVYNEDYQPVDGADAVATIYCPDGSSHEVPLQPALDQEGVFRGAWDAPAPGVYRVELTARLGDKELGKSEAYFQRADGALEYFGAEQNVAGLKRLAQETGGAYLPLDKAGELPEQLSYSPAGVSVPEIRELWDMPAWFFLLFLLKGSEWILRKRWRSI